MLDDKWLVAVTAGRWQKPGIREAQLAGLKVLAIDADKNAVGLAEADKSLVIDLQDHDEVIRMLREMNIPFCGAISFVSDAGMLLTARIREEFNMPGPRHLLSQRLINKSLQRRLWQKHAVAGPKWQVFSTPKEAISTLPSFGYPLIIKPTDSSGSRGVSKIESDDDGVEDAVKHAFIYSNSGEVIVEEYMQGTEFTVEVIVDGGEVHVLAVTEKKKVESTRGTVARELATPERPNDVVKAISDLVVSAFVALEYTDGPGHAEVILKDAGGVGMIEVAGRGGGFMVFERFLPIVTGLNVARMAVLQSVGLPIGPVNNLKRAGVLRFFPSRPGVLRGMSGFDEANLLEGIEVGAFVKVGERFSRATVDGDRLGYILTNADSPSKAQALANQAESIIHFDILDAP